MKQFIQLSEAGVLLYMRNMILSSDLHYQALKACDAVAFEK